jgi:CMP-N-acetylneuraminic acid synthetase
MKVFLPIKEHSERVPAKNFKLLRGIPLYLWILSSILEVPSVTEVCIDTDSENPDLWALDSHPRVEIKKRSRDLIGDHVSMNLLIEDYLRDFNESEEILMTHVTNPFLSSKSIQSAIEKFTEIKQQGFDSIFSVTRFQGRFYDENLTPINHNPRELCRTQDLNPVYLENSCYYIFSKKAFLESKSRIGLRPKESVIFGIESHDIDTPEDWIMAELFAQTLSSLPSIPTC